MFCTTCGTKNLADSNFCKQCGHKLEKTSPAKISEEAYDRALPEEEQVSALLERAYRWRAEGDLVAAIALCEEALHLRPNSTSAHSLLGQLYEQNGQREQAIRELETVLRLNPGSIADRVKLDELRDGDRTANRAAATPHVTLVEAHRSGSADGSLRLLVVAAVIVVLALGGAYAIVNRPRASEETSPRSMENVKVGPATDRPTENPKNDTSQADKDATTAKTVSNASNPYGYSVFPPYPYPTSQPPIIIHENLPSSRGGTAAVPHANGKRGIKPASITNNGDENRVIISAEGDGGSSDGGSPLVIPVTGSDKGGKSSPKSGGDTHVEINIQKPSQDSGAGSATADAEARGLMAMALDQKQKQNYVGAINTYRKALPSAGDDRALIYREIGYCYQQKGDKNSAISNYQSAINEYQRLLDAKRQVDQAKDGIRICQNGIKICSGD